MSKPYQTIADIAKSEGVSQRQADYATRVYSVEETARVGTIRIYDPNAAEQVKSAIKRIADRRGGGHE